MGDVKRRLDKLEKDTKEPELGRWTSETSEDGHELRMLRDGKVVYIVRFTGNVGLHEV